MEIVSEELFADRPFTPAMAARAGIGRAALDRMLREGEVSRVLRGVYLDAGLRLDQDLRARSLALRVRSGQIVARRTAAWVYGAAPDGGSAMPIDLYGVRSCRGVVPPLRAEEIVHVAGLACTSPVRTALDLGRHLAPERALPLIDGLIRAGVVTHVDLLAGCRDPDRDVRELVARADGRAACLAESVLRLHWLDAALPTPTPGLHVDGVRIALGLRAHRFGVAIEGALDGEGVGRCLRAGWRVLVLDRALVTALDGGMLTEHLEREFHQHLLRQLVGPV